MVLLHQLYCCFICVDAVEAFVDMIFVCRCVGLCVCVLACACPCLCLRVPFISGKSPLPAFPSIQPPLLFTSSSNQSEPPALCSYCGDIVGQQWGQGVASHQHRGLVSWLSCDMSGLTEVISLVMKRKRFHQFCVICQRETTLGRKCFLQC